MEQILSLNSLPDSVYWLYQIPFGFWPFLCRELRSRSKLGPKLSNCDFCAFPSLNGRNVKAEWIEIHHDEFRAFDRSPKLSPPKSIYRSKSEVKSDLFPLVKLSPKVCSYQEFASVLQVPFLNSWKQGFHCKWNAISPSAIVAVFVPFLAR